MNPATIYKEGKKMDFPAFEQEIMNQWNEGQVFKKSLAWREKNTPFIF
jgi:isoleucyl-tRNA synthetase